MRYTTASLCDERTTTIPVYAGHHTTADRKVFFLKTKRSVFQQRLDYNSFCQYCSIDVRAGHLLQIWRDEYKPLKTNATGGCLAYHTQNIKQTNKYSNRLSGTLNVNIKNRKLSRFGNVRRHDTLPKIIQQAGNSRW